MVNSRAKGCRGELEFAHKLTDSGFPARRGQQFSGGGDSPDVVCESLPIHWEVKRTERFLLYPAMVQAKRDAAPGKMPVVAHRTSRQEWVVVLTLVNFLKMFKGDPP